MASSIVLRRFVHGSSHPAAMMGEFSLDTVPDSHTLRASPVSLPPFTDHLDDFGTGDSELDAFDVQWRGAR